MLYCRTPLLYRRVSDRPALTHTALTRSFVGRAGFEPATEGL